MNPDMNFVILNDLNDANKTAFSHFSGMDIKDCLTAQDN